MAERQRPNTDTMSESEDERGSAHAPSAAGQLRRSILRGLHEGLFAPGQRLVETDLIAQFGVSRPTVRECISRLAAEGVVEVLPYRGASIRRLSTEEVVGALQLLEVCNGLASRLAAQRIDQPGNRDAFVAAWEKLRHFENGPDDYSQISARDAFYGTINRISGNRELQRIVPSIQVNLIRSSVQQTLRERFRDYKAVAGAILAGDAEAAEREARNHIARITALAKERAAD